jgi:hypothetical protein
MLLSVPRSLRSGPGPSPPDAWDGRKAYRMSHFAKTGTSVTPTTQIPYETLPRLPAGSQSRHLSLEKQREGHSPPPVPPGRSPCNEPVLAYDAIVAELWLKRTEHRSFDVNRCSYCCVRCRLEHQPPPSTCSLMATDDARYGRTQNAVRFTPSGGSTPPPAPIP